MKFFVIRHKPTGRCMPSRDAKGVGLHSHWEPTLDDIPQPRLFATEGAAKNSLSAWLRGIWVAPVEQDGSFEEGYWDYKDVPVPSGKPTAAPRIRADMEVVPVGLTGL